MEEGEVWCLNNRKIFTSCFYSQINFLEASNERIDYAIYGGSFQEAQICGTGATEKGDGKTGADKIYVLIAYIAIFQLINCVGLWGLFMSLGS